MLVLRCTQKLLMRLGKTENLSDAESTTRLGDWYGNTLNIGRQRMVIFISEHSRLAVILPARELKRLPQILPDAVAELLAGIGIPAPDIAAERAAMSEVAVGKTRNRSVLGTMNDYIAMARYSPDGRLETPETLMRFLADTPILPLNGASPIDLTRKAFGLPPMRWSSRVH